MEKNMELIINLICIINYSFFTAISFLVLFGEITLSPKFMARIIIIFSLEPGLVAIKDFIDCIEGEKIIKKQ